MSRFASRATSRFANMRAGRPTDAATARRARARIAAGCIAAAWLAALGAAAPWAPARAASVSGVFGYHNTDNRAGAYVLPALTLAHAAGLKPDPAFSASLGGHVYAQPLYWQSGSTKLLIVATTDNVVYALNADTGAQVWQAQAAPPMRLAKLPCGDIDPEGIVGTPVIDPSSNTLYLDALTQASDGTPHHMVYAFAVASGALLTGWPVDIGTTLTGRGVSFSSATQGQRGALSLMNGHIYIPYGGKAGDCGTYHGTVVELSTTSRSVTGVWSTRGIGGGVWTPAGLPRAGASLFATTGNTKGATSWSDGEAVFRLSQGLTRSSSANNFFTPANWLSLDASDLDLGGTAALPVSVPAGKTALARTIAFGKDGNAYLLKTATLGGTGGQIGILKLSTAPIITSPAVLRTSSQALVYITNYNGLQCKGTNLTAVQLAASAPLLSVAWCQPFSGGGAPIVTTSSLAGNDAMVWVTGAEGDNKLHGFNALTGASVVTSAALSGLRHFSTLIAANGHLYVAADSKVYGFIPGP